VTVCPSFSGHFQGNDVGVGFPVLVELLVELLAESLAELLVVDAESPLPVSEEIVESDPVWEDVSELMSDMDIDDDELVLRLEVVVIMSIGIIDAEPVLELKLGMSVILDELVPTDIVRVLAEVELPAAELELEELDESLAGGPAEYTMAPSG